MRDRLNREFGLWSRGDCTFLYRITGLIFYLSTILFNSCSPNSEGNKISSNEDADSSHVDSSTIYYHEDDYLMIVLTPGENFNDLVVQAENASDFAEDSYDGTGYTDINVIEESKVGLENRKIRSVELDSILAELEVARHDHVSTGCCGNFSTISKNTIGYGEGYSAIYYDSKDGIVSDIWITHFGEMDKDKVANALYEIGMKWNLLLMDWFSLQLIDLKDKDQVKGYLRK